MTQKTITLTKAVEHEGKSVSELVLSEPTSGQVLAAEKARVAEVGEHAERVRDTTLIAAVAGLHVDLVRKLPASKAREAAKYLNAFVNSMPAEKCQDPELAIALDKRIEKNGRIVTDLELREPTTGEVEEAQRKLGASYTTATMRESQMHLVCLVSELPRFIIDDVPISKMNRASRYLLGFT